MSAQLPIASARQTRAWLGRELRRRWPGVAAALGTGLVAAAASVVPVYALGVLVDQVRAGASTSVLAIVAAVIAGAAVVGAATTGLAGYLAARVGGQLLAALRERTVERALALPAPLLERAGRGDLLSRVSGDVAAIAKAASDVVPTMLSSMLLGALSIVAMAGLDWRLGLAGAVAVPMYGWALRWYLPRAAPRYAEQRRTVAVTSQHLVEGVQGIRTLHAYRLERRHLGAVDRASGDARDVAVSVFGLFTRFVSRVNRAEFVGLAAILVVGFLLVDADATTVGGAAAAAVLFHRLFNPIAMLLFTFDELQAAAASLARLVGVVERAAEAVQPGGAGEAEPADASLELTDVHFSYDGATEVLHGISLRIAPGARVALVGATGAGKSTVAALAAGQLDPGRGAVRLGGVRLAELSDDVLRARVAVITQETHVFAGPLADDLRLAKPDATSAELDAALSIVDALDWVRELPDGLQTNVGEGGHELTAAQGQQVALARLVLRDPTVAILDEATAEAGSLGARTLEAAAAAATRGRTTLVVAHRLTQAATADRVVVLDHGRVVEEGTHDELRAAGGRYADLWRAWQSSRLTIGERA